MPAASYRLVRRAGPARTRPPRLDARQRRVVDHPGGPLLVLAGPGTGKTTTIVEAVVDRIERRGADPERVLVLTFSRKAAVELRQRITGRLDRTTRTPLALTFHSYAYALLRRDAVLADDHPPRLLSGPEQLLEVRRLLEGEVADGTGGWPENLRAALGTRGFADELRDFCLRAAERGYGPPELFAIARVRGRREWGAISRFLNRYAARFDIDPVPSFDYAELIRAAAGLLSDEEVRVRERDAYDAVFVDEYQDTDPAQEYLLQQLAGGGRDLVAVGDPDQSIYGFRGADVRNILDFPARFRTLDGDPAPVVALRTCRRMAPAVLAASRRVATRLPGVAGHRDLLSPADAPDTAAPDTAAPDGDAAETRAAAAGAEGDEGDVRVVVADSVSQECALVADELRRAHLLDGVPWSKMAVLVRSAVRQVPVLRRALAVSGVPVVVAGDEVPLQQEPAVRPLLMLLRAALRPGRLDEIVAEDLLTGPLGGADALALRRLKRALRDLESLAGGTRPLAELLVAALGDERELLLVHPKVRAPAERVARLIRTAREAARGGGTAEEVLWAVWRESGLADRLLADSVRGGTRGAAADRDLDAVVALFDHAARFVDRLPKAGPELFVDDLAAQEIPGDSLAEQAPAGEAVRILTAHRSKGLEWDVVVVAGVQEGVWPDLRLRGSLLGIEDLLELDALDSLGTGGDPLPEEVAGASVAAKLLDEERRLFYVATTRARRRLVVTAVGGDDAEERPSRFLGELLPGAIEPARLDEKTRWLSMSALVADLRCVVADPARPAALRRAAAGHLARLARMGVRGAHPRDWYAITEPSDPGPAFGSDERIVISPSQVETFERCGLRWLLSMAVGAQDGGPTEYSTMGKVIHAVAELAAEDPGVSEGDIAKRLDEVWDELDFRSSWYADKQRVVAEQMVGRFLAWHAENDREIVAVEEPFQVDLGRVVIRGRVDRAERDGAGRAVIVDLKTSASAVPGKDLPRHPQLGVYQYAVMLGAFERHGLVEPGGAELIQVGKGGFAASVRIQRQEEPAADDDPDWTGRLVERVADGMANPVFEARVNEGCRSCPVRACCPAHEAGQQVTP
ncbi:MAG TPA: ATP-dependent DNA helicase [Streptosporangiaceae bacterium]|nr:ATP-dependent DNA helicase [Streptosporangiaceae bacterium]